VDGHTQHLVFAPAKAPGSAALGHLMTTASVSGRANGTLPAVSASSFSDASRRVGQVHSCSYGVAGYHIRLRFAGPALVPKLTLALDHLPPPTLPTPDLTVHIWDSVSTGSVPPPLPADVGGTGALNRRLLYEEPPVRAVFKPGRQTLSVLDDSRGEAWFWCVDAADVPYWERGTPLLLILHWWLSAHGRQLVHAGAVGTERGGVLVVGRGGSGKSTTAMASLLAGLDYASDDFVLVGTDPVPMVHSLYNSGRLEPHHIRRFPELVPMITNADELDTEKALIFVRQFAPERASSGFPLQAILLPTVTGRSPTQVVKASAGATLAALAPSTIFQLPGAGAPALGAMAALARRVPGYVLQLGTELSGIAPVIKRLLQELQGTRL
jgi:hypothetical protein